MTGGSDGDIHLWNPQSARLIKTYPGHARSVLSLALFAYNSHNWCVLSLFHVCVQPITGRATAARSQAAVTTCSRVSGTCPQARRHAASVVI